MSASLEPSLPDQRQRHSLDPLAVPAAFGFQDAELKRRLAGAARVVAMAMISDKLGTSAYFGILPASILAHLLVEAEAPEVR